MTKNPKPRIKQMMHDLTLDFAGVDAKRDRLLGTPYWRHQFEFRVDVWSWYEEQMVQRFPELFLANRIENGKRAKMVA